MIRRAVGVFISAICGASISDTRLAARPLSTTRGSAASREGSAPPDVRYCPPLGTWPARPGRLDLSPDRPLGRAPVRRAGEILVANAIRGLLRQCISRAEHAETHGQNMRKLTGRTCGSAPRRVRDGFTATLSPAQSSRHRLRRLRAPPGGCLTEYGRRVSLIMLANAPDRRRRPGVAAASMARARSARTPGTSGGASRRSASDQTLVSTSRLIRASTQPCSRTPGRSRPCRKGQECGPAAPATPIATDSPSTLARTCIFSATGLPGSGCTFLIAGGCGRVGEVQAGLAAEALRGRC